MTIPFPSTSLRTLGGRPVWNTSIDFQVLGPPVGFGRQRASTHTQELRGNKRAETGIYSPCFLPVGSLWAGCITCPKVTASRKCPSPRLYPHSSPSRFRKLLPLSSFVIIDGGNSTKLLSAARHCIQLVVSVHCPNVGK